MEGSSSTTRTWAEARMPGLSPRFLRGSCELAVNAVRPLTAGRAAPGREPAPAPNRSSHGNPDPGPARARHHRGMPGRVSLPASFRAYVVDKHASGFSRGLTTLAPDALPPGDVAVA